MEINSVLVNGIKIYPFESMEQMLDYISDKKSILIAINSKKIRIADDNLRDLVNDNIGYIDGVGAIMAVKDKGVKTAARIPGCDLWLEIIRRRVVDSSFYFIGGTQEVIDAVISKLKVEYPDINILGYRNGYLKTTEDRQAVIDDIAEKKPDIVFVAMGSPIQELLMKDMKDKHPALYQGLGGSFDVYSGKVERAPKWWIDHNAEWFYRDITNIKRIRGIWENFLFFIKLKILRRY